MVLKNNCFISTGNFLNLKQKMETAYKIASRNLSLARLKQKAGYNKRASQAILEIGDKVIVKVLVFAGLHKLAVKYEHSVYEIVDHSNKDIPIYAARNSSGKEKVI